MVPAFEVEKLLIMNKLQIGQQVQQKPPQRMAGVVAGEGIRGIVTKVGRKNVWIDTEYGGWAGAIPMILNIKLPISDLVGY